MLAPALLLAAVLGADAPAPVDYLRQIKPLLQQRCYVMGP
jgi:hypothetical protein